MTTATPGSGTSATRGRPRAAAGAYPLLDSAVRFVSARLHADGRQLAPAYTVDGGRVPDQRRLDLPGYPGGYDLIGNWVNKQFQLDTFGEALLLFAAAARHGRLDSGAWQAARIAADAIGARWQEPDAGIWELEDAEWTHSRLNCVAGLRAAAGALAASRPWRPSGPRWPTPSWPTWRPGPLTRPGAGSAHLPTPAWTRRCCSRRCAARCPRTTPARSRRCAPAARN